MSQYDDFKTAIAKRVNQFTTYPEVEAELTEISPRRLMRTRGRRTT